MRTYDETGSAEAVGRHTHQGEGVRPAPPQALVASRAADPGAVLALQRLAGNAAVTQLLADDQRGNDQPSPVLNVVGRGGGQPLDPATRATMEAGLGADFSDVRVHTDGAATASAQAVQAHAYTVGNEVVFQADRYQPESPGGQRMLAHELTHVIQQRSGPVEGTPTGGGISVSHPADGFEQAAESNADRFMSTAGSIPAASAPASPVASGVQRSSDDDQSLQGLFVQRQEEEEEVQGSFVQREGEEEEKEEPAAG